MSEAVENDLLNALCHEMGNVVGALRLEAHLIDQEMSPRDLATTRAELDGLAARLTALLSLMRPLTSDGPRRVDQIRLVDLVGSVERAAEALLVPGVDVEFMSPPDDWLIEVDAHVIESRVSSLLYLSVENVRPKGAVRVRTERNGREVGIFVEDGAPVDEDPAQWSEQAKRGRPLLCAISDDVLRKRGGRVVAERDGDQTRVELWWPLAESADAAN